MINSYILIYVIIFILSDKASCVSNEVLSCLRQERSPSENPMQNIITVTSQQPAYLHCKVAEGTNYMVAWTRSSDQALLTAGQQSFTSDSRFQISKKSDSDWILILRRADISDTGCYLCEINSEPVSTIYAVYLQVQEAAPAPSSTSAKKVTKLMANMAGDEVLLNCTVTLDDSSEEDIIWTRDGKNIDLNNTAKYVWKVKRSAGIIVHTIRIRDATMEDDGDYACQNKHNKASQIVHINKAEAQRSLISSSLNILHLFCYIILFFIL